MCDDDDDFYDGKWGGSALSVKDLIPESRLSTAGGGSLNASDPAVCDGDDVYEMDLTRDGADDDRSVRRHRQLAELETWMLPNTEHTFLKCIVGSDASDVVNLIAYAEKNHWFGGKKMFLNLDVSKTILNRQIKLVLYNSRPQNTLNYHVSNASKPLKKTDFILEEWPYVSVNQPLVLKGSEDELAPWIRSKNKQFNVHLPKSDEIPKPAHKMPIDQQQVTHDDWRQQKEQQQQEQEQEQQQQQQQNQQQQQHEQPQHQQQQQQRSNNFFQQPSSRQVLMFNRPPIVPYIANFACLQPWHGSNFYQRFPTTPFTLPATPPHYHWNPINTDLPPTTIQHGNIRYENTVLQQAMHFKSFKSAKEEIDHVPMWKPYNNDSGQLQEHDTGKVNDECIDKIISTFETNNKDALRSFLCLLKNVYPKKLEEFNKIMSTMDYLNSQPSVNTL